MLIKKYLADFEYKTNKQWISTNVSKTTIAQIQNMNFKLIVIA